MRRIQYAIILVITALGLVSCAIDQLSEAGPDGSPVDVSFEVGVKEALTKANPETTSLDDASGEFELYVAVFDKADGTLSTASMIGEDGYQKVATLKDGSASLKLTLSRSREYKIVFFAMKDGAYVTFFSNASARFSIAKNNTANNAAMDAFYASIDVTAAKTTHEITLKRPFAQLNVLVPADNVPAGQTEFRSTMKVKMPIFFDLYEGKANKTEAEVTFEGNAIDAKPFGKYADTSKPYKWIAMNYVLVPESGTVEVTSFQEDGMAAAAAIGEVPVKVNGRTNLVGNVYGDEFDLDLTVTIDPGFGSEEENPEGGETPGQQPMGGDFVRLTDPTELQAGDEIIVVYEEGSVALGQPSDNGNYRLPVDVTITGDTISNPDAKVQVITLEESGDEGWWYLAVDGGYLASQSGNSNYLLTVTEKSDYALWIVDTNNDEILLYTADGDRCLLCYNVDYPRFSCYDFYSPQELVSVFVRSGGSDKSEAILEHKELGCFLPGHTRDYTAGVDQYVREYDGDKLTFVLMKPADNEQMVITGYSSSLKAGDAVTLAVDWKKGTTRVLSDTYAMTVIKEDGRKVWIADKKGNGFVIKK